MLVHRQVLRGQPLLEGSSPRPIHQLSANTRQQGQHHALKKHQGANSQQKQHQCHVETVIPRPTFTYEIVSKLSLTLR